MNTVCLSDAIRKHDELCARLWSELDVVMETHQTTPDGPGLHEKAEHLFERMDASAREVGEVFYELTKHINCRENCLLGCGRSEFAKRNSRITFDVAGQIPNFFRRMAVKYG